MNDRRDEVRAVPGNLILRVGVTGRALAGSAWPFTPSVLTALVVLVAAL